MCLFWTHLPPLHVLFLQVYYSILEQQRHVSFYIDYEYEGHFPWTVNYLGVNKINLKSSKIHIDLNKLIRLQVDLSRCHENIFWNSVKRVQELYYQKILITSSSFVRIHDFLFKGAFFVYVKIFVLKFLRDLQSFHFVLVLGRSFIQNCSLRGC